MVWRYSQIVDHLETSMFEGKATAAIRESRLCFHAVIVVNGTRGRRLSKGPL